LSHNDLRAHTAAEQASTALPHASAASAKTIDSAPAISDFTRRLPIIAASSHGAVSTDLNPPSTSAFSPETLALQQRLTAAGFKIDRVLPSAQEHLFEDQRGATIFNTSQGNVEVLFFSSAESSHAVTVTTNHVGNRYEYVLKQGQNETRLDIPDRQYFVSASSMLFITSDQNPARKLAATFGMKTCSATSSLCREKK
jgi:hypothetical protein